MGRSPARRARRAAALRRCCCARRRSGATRPQRFAGRDHVRVELRPLSRKTRRERSRAPCSASARPATRRAARRVHRRSRPAGSPLFAEELARVSRRRDATRRARRRSRPPSRCTSTRSTTRARDAASQLAVFGHARVGRRARRRSAWPTPTDALRELATRRAARRAGVVALQGHARVGVQARADARGRLRLARRGRAARRCTRGAGHWLAKMGEDDATVARHLELGGDERRRGGVPREGGAPRARRQRARATPCRSPSARSPSRRTSRRSSRARSSSTRRGAASTRAPASATRRCARWRRPSTTSASEVRAAGARVRYEDACGGDAETSARLEQVRERRAGGRARRRGGALRRGARRALRVRGRARPRRAEVAEHLLRSRRSHGIAGAAVDAWQTLAVVRQTRGEVGAALEARRSAARAAQRRGAQDARGDADDQRRLRAHHRRRAGPRRALAIESGIALAQAIGSPGTVRHGQMNLLCWAATFGADAQLDALLAEPRAIADAALAGSWVPHDRATLGVLFYRGMELLRGDARRRRPRARARSSGPPRKATARPRMLDVVARRARLLGRGRAPLRRRRAGARARERGGRLLDEARRACSTRRRCSWRSTTPASISASSTRRASAIARGMPRLVTRVQGPRGYALRARLPHAAAPNAGLLAAAEAYGLVPRELQVLLER